MEWVFFQLHLNFAQHLAYVGKQVARAGNTEPNGEFFQLDRDLEVGVDHRQKGVAVVAPPLLAAG